MTFEPKLRGSEGIIYVIFPIVGSNQCKDPEVRMYLKFMKQHIMREGDGIRENIVKEMNMVIMHRCYACMQRKHMDMFIFLVLNSFLVLHVFLLSEYMGIEKYK